VFPWDPCSAALRTEVHSGSGPSFAESFCFYVRDDVSYPLAPVDTERVCAALGIAAQSFPYGTLWSLQKRLCSAL